MNTLTTRQTGIIILSIIFILSTATFNLSCTGTKANGSPDKNSAATSDAAGQQNQPDEPMLFAIKVGDKWGYIDNIGKVVVKPQYERTFDLVEGLGRIMAGKMYGFVNSLGKIVIGAKYNDARDFSEGYAAVCEGNPWDGTGKWGFIDKSGKYVIKPQFTFGSDFHEGLASATLFNHRMVAPNDLPTPHWGFIDQKGDFVIKPEYYLVDDFSENMAAVQTDHKWGYIDKTGAFVIQPQFDLAHKFKQGLATVYVGEFPKEGKWGYIDKTGKIMIDTKYDDAGEFSEGLAPVRILADEKYTDITGASHYLTEGAHDFKGIRGRWAFIDRTGRIIIEPKFDEALPFTEGLAAVCIGNPNFNKGKWGFIDTSGNYVMDPQFAGAGDFKHGLATARIPGWTGFINKAGAFTWSTVEEEPVIMPTPEGDKADKQ
jgi:hypothetical protein